MPEVTSFSEIISFIILDSETFKKIWENFVKLAQKKGRQAGRPKNDPPPRWVRNGPHKQPRNGKWSDLAIQEVREQINDVTEVSTYAFSEYPEKMPRNKEDQVKIIEELKAKSSPDIEDSEMTRLVNEGRNLRIL